MVRYLRNKGYAAVMDVTKLNRGHLYFILKNPDTEVNNAAIRQIYQQVVSELGVRGYNSI